MGSVYAWFNRGNTKTDWTYPNGKNLLFSDEDGKASDSNLISFIRKSIHKERKYEYFMIGKANGLTKAGLARITQSIEAFVYCILGSHVNVRTSILGIVEALIRLELNFLY